MSRVKNYTFPLRRRHVIAAVILFTIRFLSLASGSGGQGGGPFYLLGGFLATLLVVWVFVQIAGWVKTGLIRYRSSEA